MNKNIKMDTSSNPNEIKIPSEFEISHSYEGGYTNSYSDSLPRKISVNQDGEVKIEINGYFENCKSYKVEKIQAINLMKFFYENKFYELPEDLSDHTWSDSSTSYLTVISNTFNRRVGGYAASGNEKFSMFLKQFDSIFNDDILEELNKNLEDF